MTPPRPSAPTEPDPQVSLFICLRFFPSERLVSAISRLVCDFCEVALADLDVGARFQMAAHELAENITKYSTSDRVSLEVELLELPDRHLLRIRTRNQTTENKLREVQKRLEELRAAADPQELYDRLVLETAPLKGTSGLGLARIVAEGGLDFNYSIKDDELTVEVQSAVQRGALSAPPVRQLGIHRVAAHQMELSPSLGAHGIEVRVQGQGDSFAVPALKDYLSSIVDEMTRLDVRRVAFDVRHLAFLNSSGLKQFVSFLHTISTAGMDAEVEFIVDPAKAWQRRSLSALNRMCPDIVRIVEAGEQPPTPHFSNAPRPSRISAPPM